MKSSEPQVLERNDTIFLRFVAILLITNSHLGLYYPIQHFATGASIGNSLFLALSSFGLLLSQRDNPKTFKDWYTKRIQRIYPATSIMIISLILPYQLFMNTFDFRNFLAFFGNFFYPPFWFIEAIMIYYFLTFWIIKEYSDRKIYFMLFLLTILYAIIYLSCLDLSKWSIETQYNSFRYLFYYMIFIFGIFIGDRNNRIQYAGIQDWGILFVLIFIIYGHKFLMLKNITPSFQFIQHLTIFPLIYYFLKISRSHLVKKKVMTIPILSTAINYIGDSTLEFYIVQVSIVDIILSFRLPFPINVLVFLTATILIASLVKYLSGLIISSKFIRE